MPATDLPEQRIEHVELLYGGFGAYTAFGLYCSRNLAAYVLKLLWLKQSQLKERLSNKDGTMNGPSVECRSKSQSRTRTKYVLKPCSDELHELPPYPD
jgi:hypothetical protein